MRECIYCGKDHNPNESRCRKIDMREQNFHLNKKLEDSLIREKSLESENAELKQMQEHLKWKDEVRRENKRLREFKEFVNMMVRRSLNHTCSDYEALMSIDEKLIKE